jgi:hypothetical protein
MTMEDMVLFKYPVGHDFLFQFANHYVNDDTCGSYAFTLCFIRNWHQKVIAPEATAYHASSHALLMVFLFDVE